MRSTVFSVAMAGAFMGLAAFAAQEADARGRGGGARGGGASSMSRGGGGGFGGGGAGFNRGGGGGGSAHKGGSFSRSGNYSRPSGGAAQRPAQRPGGGGSGTQRPSQRPGGGGSGTQRPGQGGNINTGNINTGDINIDRDVHVDVDNDWNGWGGYYDHPIAAGVAIGAVAGITAAAIGSRYYALPPGCSPYPYSSLTYYSCGSAWYQPTYQGDTVVYVVVDKPG